VYGDKADLYTGLDADRRVLDSVAAQRRSRTNIRAIDQSGRRHERHPPGMEIRSMQARVCGKPNPHEIRPGWNIASAIPGAR